MGRKARLGRPRSHFRPSPDDGILDEVAITRAAAGERLPLTLPEAKAVAARLTAAGRSSCAIATVIGCDQTTVDVWRRQWSAEQEAAQL
jgi:hypothetical protein